MTIMIIEDDTLWQTKLNQILQEVGYKNILISDNIYDANKLLTSHKIDFLICDILLNNKNVFELFELQETHLIPTIFVSSFYDNFIKEKTKNILFHLFLEKPLNKISIQTSINTLLLLKENYNSTATEKRHFAKSINEVFDIFKSTKLLEYLKIGEIESDIMYERLANNKSFTKIAEARNMTDENVRQLYLQGIKRLKPKLKSSIARFNFFIEKTKNLKNKISLTNQTIENNLAINIDSIDIDEYLKCSIDDLELLGTKWKNVLHQKGVHKIEHIIALTKRQLLLYPHFGNYSIALIELELSHKGLKLKKG